MGIMLLPSHLFLAMLIKKQIQGTEKIRWYKMIKQGIDHGDIFEATGQAGFVFLKWWKSKI